MSYMMLWFCGMDAPVADCVNRAAAFFEGKYGEKPTLCLLPKNEPDIPGSIGSISCRSDDKVDTGHLMMGVG